MPVAAQPLRQSSSQVPLERQAEKETTVSDHMLQRVRVRPKQSLTKECHVRFEKLAVPPQRPQVIPFALIIPSRNAKRMLLMAAAGKAIMCAPFATANIAWPTTKNRD
jgi:hypothetical protein